MKKVKNLGLSLLSCTILISASNAMADGSVPSKDEMWKIIQQQQKQIKDLTARLDNNEKKITKNTKTAKKSLKKVAVAEKRAVEADAKVQKKVERVEKQVASISAVNVTDTTADDDFSSFGASSSPQGWWNKTSVGGYGELHFNSGKTVDEIDFHRFVLFVNHEFNDKIRLYTELELEHSLAGEGKNGEVELEQAYIEMDVTDKLAAKAGLMLLPVGILNEIHEPATFYGTERNPVEKNIIPTTWWEAGLGLSGHNDSGLSYDLVVHSGLQTPTTGSNAFKIRNGRQKVSQASAENGATTARIKYTGVPGLELAASAQYQDDIAQGTLSSNIPATLVTTHADYKNKGFGLRALFASWNVQGSAVAALGRDEQLGYYIEPSYKFTIGEIGDLGFFGRYNYHDNNAGNSTNTEIHQYDIGMNFWPHQNVVFKADLSIIDEDNGGIDDEIFNLGVGFQF